MDEQTHKPRLCCGDFELAVLYHSGFEERRPAIRRLDGQYWIGAHTRALYCCPWCGVPIDGDVSRDATRPMADAPEWMRYG